MPGDDVCDDVRVEKKVCPRRAFRVAILRQFLILVNRFHLIPMAAEGADMKFRATSLCRGSKQQVEVIAGPRNQRFLIYQGFRKGRRKAALLRFGRLAQPASAPWP